MKRYLILLLLIVFSSAGVTAAETSKTTKATAKKIQGVWSLDNMDVGKGANKANRTDAQFMIYITKSHYSAIRDLGTKENRSFMADAGTYVFTGEEMIVSHMLAAFPFLGEMTFKVSMQGDNILILEPQYDKMKVSGQPFKLPEDGKMGYGEAAVKYVFKRLE